MFASDSGRPLYAEPRRVKRREEQHRQQRRNDQPKARGEQRIREWFARRYKNADLGPKVSIWGSSAECAEKIQELVQAGAQHIVFNPMFDETEHLEICAREIMPHL